MKGPALSIGPNWVCSTGKQRQNPVSETSCFKYKTGWRIIYRVVTVIFLLLVTNYTKTSSNWNNFIFTLAYYEIPRVKGVWQRCLYFVGFNTQSSRFLELIKIKMFLPVTTDIFYESFCFRVRFPALPDFLISSICNGVHSASWVQLRSYLKEKRSGSGLESRDYSIVLFLYFCDLIVFIIRV
jgi:hypothetical protein